MTDETSAFPGDPRLYSFDPSGSLVGLRGWSDALPVEGVLG